MLDVNNIFAVLCVSFELLLQVVLFLSSREAATHNEAVIISLQIGLLDLDNICIAVGISLLSCIQAELQVFQVLWPPSWISDFRLLNYFWLSSVLHKGNVCTQNHWCSRWTCVPNWCWTEDLLYFTSFASLSYYSRFWTAMMAIWWMLDLLGCHHSPVIFRGSHQSVSVDSIRFKNGG